MVWFWISDVVLASTSGTKELVVKLRDMTFSVVMNMKKLKRCRWLGKTLFSHWFQKDSTYKIQFILYSWRRDVDSVIYLNSLHYVSQEIILIVASSENISRNTHLSVKLIWCYCDPTASTLYKNSRALLAVTWTCENEIINHSFLSFHPN